MTGERERAIETLKENLCAMCAYGSQSMASCDIRGCDNRDAIKALEQEPCEGAISREAVCNIVNDIRDCISVEGYWAIFERLKKLPSVKPQESKWIPVSERLPEEHLCDDGYVEPSDYVLVWGDHGNYGVSRYWGNRRSKSESPNTHKDWVDLDWVVQKPIAWMPLPEPYKAESEG